MGKLASYFVGSFGVQLPAEAVRTTESGFIVRFEELRPESLELLDRVISRAEVCCSD